MKTKTLLAGRNREALSGLLGGLKNIGSIDVVGATTKGEKIPSLVKAQSVDALILELSLAQPDNAGMIKKILASHPLPILLVGSGNNPQHATAAFEALASGALTVLDVSTASFFKQASFQNELKSIFRNLSRFNRKALIDENAETHAMPFIDSAHLTPDSIIAVAGGSGGIPVLRRLLTHLPKHLDAPILVVQAVPVTFTAPLAGWLDSLCDRSVIVAREGEPLRPRHVHVVPVDRYLEITRSRTIRYIDESAGLGFGVVISQFFGTVLAVSGEHAVGVLLSGEGTEGIDNLRKIKDRGGFSIVQAMSSAMIKDLPAAAIKGGAASIILSPDQIPGQIDLMAVKRKAPGKVETDVPVVRGEKDPIKTRGGPLEGKPSPGGMPSAGLHRRKRVDTQSDVSNGNLVRWLPIGFIAVLILGALGWYLASYLQSPGSIKVNRTETAATPRDERDPTRVALPTEDERQEFHREDAAKGHGIMGTKGEKRSVLTAWHDNPEKKTALDPVLQTGTLVADKIAVEKMRSDSKDIREDIVESAATASEIEPTVQFGGPAEPVPLLGAAVKKNMPPVQDKAGLRFAGKSAGSDGGVLPETEKKTGRARPATGTSIADNGSLQHKTKNGNPQKKHTFDATPEDESGGFPAAEYRAKGNPALADSLPDGRKNTVRRSSEKGVKGGGKDRLDDGKTARAEGPGVNRRTRAENGSTVDLKGSAYGRAQGKNELPADRNQDEKPSDVAAEPGKDSKGGANDSSQANGKAPKNAAGTDLEIANKTGALKAPRRSASGNSESSKTALAGSSDKEDPSPSGTISAEIKTDSPGPKKTVPTKKLKEKRPLSVVEAPSDFNSKGKAEKSAEKETSTSIAARSGGEMLPRPQLLQRVDSTLSEELPTERKTGGRVKRLGSAPGGGDANMKGDSKAPENRSVDRRVAKYESGHLRTFSGIQFVWIPGGTYRMGTPAEQTKDVADEHPSHEVLISNGFWMGKFEVTKAQWMSVMKTAPWSNQSHAEPHPMSPATHINWEEVQAYIRKLNGSGRPAFRLPTEAEWEYACRAGSQTPFFFGRTEHQMERFAWYLSNTQKAGKKGVQPVGKKNANDWGLYDILGNAVELCLDWYGVTYYSRSPYIDPKGPVAGTLRVARGGSWRTPAAACRSARRFKIRPRAKGSDLGFRLVREASLGHNISSREHERTGVSPNAM